MANVTQVKKHKKSIIDYIFTVGSRGMNRLFALLISVIIARSLGAESFGIYSLFFGIFILIFQAQAGTNIAYVRFTKTSDHEESKIIRLSLNFQLILAFILLTAGYPAAYVISQLLNISDTFSIYAGIASSALLGVFGILFGIYQSKGKFIYLGFLNLLFNLCIFVFVAILFITDYKMELTQILYSYLVFSFILGFSSLVLLWIKSSSVNNKFLSSDFYKMIGLNISVTLLYFVYRYIDVYFIQYYSTLEAVGIYSAAMKTSMLLNILTGALPTILLPKSVTAIESRKKLIAYLKKSYTLVALIILFFSVFIIFSPELLNLLFGEQFISASYTLQILVVGWMLNTAYIPFAQIFYALNKVKWRLLIEAIKLIVSVACFMLLIPAYGGEGAAYALIIAILVAIIVAIPICLTLVRGHFNKLAAV